MKGKYILFFVVAVILATCVYLFAFKKKPKTNDLTIYGNVDIREVNLGFRVAGKISKMFHEEGDQVKKGDLLASLDVVPYEEDLDQAQAELKASQSVLSKYKKGSRKEDIAAAKAVMEEKQAALRNASTIYQRSLNLFKEGAISQQDLDNARDKYDQFKSQLESTEDKYELALNGFREEEISEAQANAIKAQAKLDRSKTNLDDTLLYAPANGTILTRVQEEGAVVASGATVYALALTSPIWIRTYVNEPDLGKIFPGMKVKIYTDTNNESYAGQIGFISPLAEFTPKSVETTALRTDLVYRLRIIVENPDNRLRQGMPVTIKIPLKQKN